ncbi:MAG: hypothetical protein JWN07_3200 [Hyphomicrobiales bacterium]|nr:hypothetical protein [Hyphomicrobiales bacterium]
MAVKRDLKPVKRRDQARILSASVIGAAALALVGGVAYVQMKQGEGVSPFAIENPAPPPDLARAEAARAAAEKRLAEAMAIQIVNIPSASQPSLARSPAERATPPNEQLARADVQQSAPTPPPPLIMPTAPSSMDVAEQDALLNRVTGLLRQGDVGAARAVLNRLVRENNAKAAFILAQSYDPSVLRQGRVVGMRADPNLARSLYEQALRGGVTEAKAALDTLASAE